MRILAFVLFVLAVLVVVANVTFGVTAGIIAAGLLAATALVLVLHAYFALSLKLDTHLEKLREEHVTTTRQVQSLLYLSSVIKPRMALPETRSWCVSPDFAATLVSLIAEMKPATILELGSGTSTVFCGYSLEALTSGMVISVDDEAPFAKRTAELMREHALERFCRIIHSPMREISRPQGKWLWYDPAFIKDLPPIDLLIVDGPVRTGRPLARYPALPLLFERLSPSAVVLIDDANSADEREMVRRWMAEFPGFAKTELPHEKGTVLLRKAASPIRSHWNDSDSPA